jgi:hypothetical protein
MLVEENTKLPPGEKLHFYPRFSHLFSSPFLFLRFFSFSFRLFIPAWCWRLHATITRYISALGGFASAGVEFVARWKLYNPPVAYRPFALNQTFGFFTNDFRAATPDLWLAVLHKRLVGTRAPVAVQVNQTNMVAWAHAQDSVLVLLVANPTLECLSVHLKLPPGVAFAWRDEYLLTPSDPGNATSATASLNGGPPLMLDPTTGALPPLAPRSVAASSLLILPALSYGYALFREQVYH